MYKQLFYTAAIALLLSYEVHAAPPPYETSTSNQALVAEKLEKFNPVNLKDSPLLELHIFSVPETKKILDQMSGQQYSTLFATSEVINRQFIRSLFDPLRFQISNPCSYTDEIHDPCSSKGINAWASVKGGRNFHKGNPNADGFKMSGYGVAFGAQKRLTPCWTFGAGGFYSNHHAHFNVGGALKSNSLLGAIYGLYRPAHYYALANVIFGGSKNTMHRRVYFGSEKADFHPHTKPYISMVSFYGEAGFDWTCSNVLVQPFIGLEASRFVRNGKCEKGWFSPLRLIYRGKETENAFSRLGVHLTTPENCYDLTFAFDLAWQYRLTRWKSDERMEFKEFGSDFTITGVPMERNSIGLGMVVWSEIMEGWTAYLQASGEAWKRTTAYDFTAGVIFKW